MNPQALEIVWLSLKVAVACVAISLPPGVLCGWLLARSSFRGKVLLDGILHLPLVLPPVVTGYLLLMLLGQRGPVGMLLEQVGIRVAFDWKGAVLASAVVAFPLLLRSVRSSIENVDPRLESAARTLGAGRIRAFSTVTLRMALPGVFVGGLLSFARSLGEFGATITFVSNIPGQTRTLPLAIYTFINQPGGDREALGLVVLSIALSLAALAASEVLTRRVRRG